MQITYIGPHAAVELPLAPGNPMSAWVVAEKDGEPLDLPAHYAKALVAEQPSNWQPVAKSAPTKAKE